MMLSKCYTQYVNKSGRPSSDQRTGQCQSSSQFPRRAVLKNALSIRQLHSSPMLVRSCLRTCMLVFSIMWIKYFEWVSEVAQSCPTLCKPMDCSLPGSSVHGILQARILKWVAISFSRGSSQLRDQTQVSCIVGRHFTIWATREVL